MQAQRLHLPCQSRNALAPATLVWQILSKCNKLQDDAQIASLSTRLAANQFLDTYFGKVSQFTKWYTVYCRLSRVSNAKKMPGAGYYELLTNLKHPLRILTQPFAFHCVFQRQGKHFIHTLFEILRGPCTAKENFVLQQ